MSAIRSVEIVEYAYQAKNCGTYYNAYQGAYYACYEKGASKEFRKYVVAIETDDGLRGEYAPQFGASRGALGQTLVAAPLLLGRDPEQREKIYLDLKIHLKHFDQSGIAALDIALWDLAGKKYNTSVTRLIGGYREELPVYASTIVGQPAGTGGLDSPEAYAEFARHCRSLGIPGFKIHAWRDGDARREAALLHAVRNAAGDEMYLMTDTNSSLATYTDALYVGRACDETNCLWFEDPYMDGSASAFSQKRLREQLRTPLLLGEHIRGMEQKADFLLAGGTDILHIDPDLDGGITNSLHLAHFAAALGVDISLHTPGPAHRHIMAASRNCKLYELGLVSPDDRPNTFQPPIYACGYSDTLDAVTERGTLPVPTGPGLGVIYDWDAITSMEVARHAFTA